MAKEIELNIFELMKDWFDFCFENPELVNSNHSAMYFFILSHSNRLGWKQKFGLPMQMTMDAIGIKNYRTFSNTFNDIVNWGFVVLLQKSVNQYSANVVALVKNTKATTKALSKATQKHSQKQVHGIVGIIKPITNIPNTREREENPPPENTVLEKFINSSEISLDECFENLNSNDYWIETISMNYHFKSIDITKQWLGLFKKKLQNEGVEKKSINDAKSHFARWLNLEISKNKKDGKNIELTTTEGQLEFLNAVASGIARAEYN